MALTPEEHSMCNTHGLYTPAIHTATSDPCTALAQACVWNVPKAGRKQHPGPAAYPLLRCPN